MASFLNGEVNRWRKRNKIVKKLVKLNQKRGDEPTKAPPIQYIEQVMIRGINAYEFRDIERRRFSMIHPFYRAIMQLAEAGDMAAIKDQERIREEVNIRTFPFNKIHELFVRAFDQKDQLRNLRANLLQVLQEDPDNLEARFYLDYYNLEYVESLQEDLDRRRQLEEVAMDLWKKEC